MKLLTKEQQEQYEKCKNLLYCKVSDPCHYTGEYRGAAHSICSLKYSVPKYSPYSFS